ncbi:exopolysaccharide biosynthesis protein [Mesorhizobium sp. M7A.F.Ca.CA.004.06.1.1]|uniref:GumC family protein n=1 Tax=Mesorhizobium sp. M7A.F.Ca.CA.004.06.1.1 TaxID=2496686 RepID=UPI000FCCDAED|nr:exopolysaccharide transport family protein [Mesorhizobium sp. M7A.F.Ca.CA.004.06.1.1]RVB78514.1 exopolysaccharide biosynthesis protein [Mesorhizobium sp. M7A.F.Ca.CA.004.06.1.1]
MVGSAISPIQLPRVNQLPAPVLEGRVHVRSLREYVEPPTASRQLFVILARRKWSIIAFAVLGGLLAGLLGSLRPVLYESTTQLIVDAPSRGSLPVGAPSSQDLVDSSIDDHITMLSSQDHLRRVMAALRKTGAAETGQDNSASRNSRLEPSATPPPRTRSLAGGLLDRLWPGADQAANSPQAEDASELRALRRGMRVGQELRSRVISVAFADDSPARAALVANTFAQVYVDTLTKKRQASDQQELDAITASLPGLQNDLQAAANRLEKYRLSHGAIDQGSADNAARERADLSQQLSMSKADLAAVESRLRYVQQLREQGATLIALAEAIGAPELADLAARQALAPADQELRATTQSKIEQGVDKIAADANIFRAQIAALESRKNILDAVMADTASRLSGLRALEPQVSLLTQRYNELLGRQQDLTRRIGVPSAGISILSAAWPPTIPQTLPAIFLVPPGMILFAILGAMYVTMRNHFDRTFRGEAEAEAVLKVPCMGQIPEACGMHAKQLRNLVLGERRSAYSRAVTSLLIAAAPNALRARSSYTALVTSSMPQDGGTELAWSLALAGTRLGGRVLLVDLERKGVQLTLEFLHQFSERKNRHSFADYVCNRCDLEGAVARLHEIGIDVMTAAPSDDLLALLSCEDGGKVMADLHATYRIVIINLPSALGRPEAKFLPGWADVVLFAIRWRKTPRTLARGVLELLQGNGSLAIPVGSVLTRVNLKKHAGYRLEDSADLLREQIA